MKELQEWIENLKKVDDVDLEPIQQNILDLQEIDLKIDKDKADFEKEKAALEETANQDKKEIQRLKDKVWDLFERQTGPSKKDDDQRDREEKEIKKNFITNEYIKEVK